MDRPCPCAQPGGSLVHQDFAMPSFFQIVANTATVGCLVSCRAHPTPGTPRSAAPIRRRASRSPALVVTEMRLRLFMMAAVFGVATAATPANAETVTFQSGSYADFRQLFSRET